MSLWEKHYAGIKNNNISEVTKPISIEISLESSNPFLKLVVGQLTVDRVQQIYHIINRGRM